MARLPRLYRVVGHWPDGTRRTRNYLTPEAAKTRAESWEAGRPAEDEREALPPASSVEQSTSYPVTFPSIASDRFDIPDSVISRAGWNDLAERLGIKPEAVLSVTVGREVIVVEYDPDPTKPGKRAPQTWTVYIEEAEPDGR